jgi:hypothetical protein
VALTTHPHLAPRLKKEWSYTSTPSVGLGGLFLGELYLYLYLNKTPDDLRFEFLQVQEIFFPFRNVQIGGALSAFYSMSTRLLSQVVRRPGSGFDHSPSSEVDVKNNWSSNFTPFIRLHGADRNDFNFTSCL